MNRTNWFRMMIALLSMSAMLFLGLACSGGDDDDDFFDDDDDDDDDNDDNDDGDPIDDVPDDVNDFLDQDDLDALEDAGMTIYKGDNPPNIEDSYLLDSLLITYDEVGMQGYTVGAYLMSYYDQTNAGNIKNDYEGVEIADEGIGIGGFISGDNDCFTVYLDIDGEIPGCVYSLPAIQSGCLESGGLADFDWGFIMKSKQGTSCDDLMETDAVRIITESDGMASRQ